MKILSRALLCLSLIWSAAAGADLNNKLQVPQLYGPTVETSAPAIRPLHQAFDEVVNCTCECVGELMRCAPAGCSTLEGNKCPLPNESRTSLRNVLPDYGSPVPPRRFIR